MPVTQESPGPRTLVDALRSRADRDPHGTAFSFFVNEQVEELDVSYATLDLRARAIAVQLAANASRGDRALLLYPPGPDYVASFFGCLYAGVVAIPAYAPEAGRLRVTLPRLNSIAESARPTVVLAPEPLPDLPSVSEAVKRARWLDTSVHASGLENQWRDPGLGGDTVAFLQFTSGSTASPRGVVLSHSNLIANIADMAHAFGVSVASHAVIWLPPFHDMGLIGGVLLPIVVGFPVTLMAPRTFLQRPLRWLRAISRHRATVSGGPNFAFELCAQKATAVDLSDLDLSSWQVAFTGAEPIRAETLSRFAATFASCGFRASSFRPCYGLAEATLMVTAANRDAGAVMRDFDAASLDRGVVALPAQGKKRSLVGVGAAQVRTSVEIVDPQTATRLQPGHVGEVWVSGPGVAAGYFERPEESELVFGGRLPGREESFLRTGDLGFFDAGDLFITGRQKDLIIIRGRNIHPQDIESTIAAVDPALRSHGGVAFSVDVDGEERLVVVQELRGGDADDIAKRGAAAILAEHEIDVEALLLVRPGVVPRTSSGKLQRSTCRGAYLRGELRPLNSVRLREAVAAAHVSARGPADADGVSGWLRCEIAKLAGIDADRVDDERGPLHHGLDSLKVLELSTAIEDRYAVSVPLTSIFGAATLHELASAIETAKSSPAAAPTSGTAASSEALSDGERALLIMHALAPDSRAGTIARAFHLKAVDVGVLAHALQALVARHPALRTTFPVVDGEPTRHVAPEARPDWLELSTSPEASEAKRRAQLEAFVARPFDLARGPLFRALVITDGVGGATVGFAVHHVVADLSSLLVLAKDLSDLYATVEARRSLPDPRSASGWIAEIAAENGRAEGIRGQRALEYFRGKLTGDAAPLELPADRARPATASFRGRRSSFRFGPALLSETTALARATGCTLHTVLLAAFYVLLHRLSGRDDIVIGVPSSGGQATGRRYVGYAVNVLPVRVDLRGDERFVELLRRIRAGLAEAIEHRNIPLARIVQDLCPGRAATFSPLFQVMFQTLPSSAASSSQAALDAIALGVDGPAGALGGLQVHPVPLDQAAAQVDLSIAVAETADGLVGAVEYAADLFDPATVDRMIAQLERVLADAVRSPDRQVGALQLIDEAERRLLVEAWNPPAIEPRYPTIQAYARAQASRTPDAPAIEFADQVITYTELIARVDRLALRLAQLGIGRGDVVAIAMRRTPTMIVALLAVLEVGAAYLPLDLQSPASRTRGLLDDADVELILVDPHADQTPYGGRPLFVVDESADGASIDKHERVAQVSHERSLAYVIYTSGSTGKPKGVAIEHRSVTMLLEWVATRFGSDELARVLAATSICFDLSVFELFGTLAWGGTVVLVESALALPAMIDSGITLVNTVPSLMAEIVAAGSLPRSVRTVNLAGEALSGALVRAVYALGHVERVYNLYGPSEDTTYSTEALIDRDVRGAASIGFGLPGKSSYVLDANGALVPIGVAGELYLGGVGLARGYHGNPELTSSRFVPDGISGSVGARLYRTGDRARWSAEGRLEFLGRVDHQVKVRGHRIELGEVEAALSEVTAEAVVVSDRDPHDSTRIVGYWVRRPAGVHTDAELKAVLSRRLPTYMIPAVLVKLPQLPRTPNGKIDRRALPAVGHLLSTRTYVAPQTTHEAAVAAAFETVLGLERVGVEDDFFELGGHSLLAMRVVAHIRTVLGVELPVRSLFETPTVRQLASAIGARSGAVLPPIEPAERSGDLVLSYAQERMWLLDRLVRNAAVYHVTGAVRLTGRLRVDALERTLDGIVRRHEALRTTFAADDGIPRQVIAAEQKAALAVIDLTGAPADEVARKLKELAERPFDLAVGPLARWALLRLGAEDHVLLAVMHHIVADGWSIGVLTREVAALYAAHVEGTPVELSGLRVQYADYAAWQRRWLEAGELDRQLDYWKTQLAGIPSVLELPTDRARPAVQSQRGKSRRFDLSVEETEALKALSQAEGGTLFMTLLAGFQALIHRYSGQKDVVVGTPIANRRTSDLEGLIGFFVNTLVMRTDLSGDPTVRELLGRVKRTALGAYDHQDAPFERVVEALHPARSLSHTPLFQVMFVFQNAPTEALALPGLALQPVDLDTDIAKFDLMLTFSEDRGALRGAIEYATDLFDEDTIDAMMDSFRVLLAAMTSEPAERLSRLPLLGPSHRRAVIELGAGVPSQHVDRFEERLAYWCRETPNAIALVEGDNVLRYGALDLAIEEVVARLRAAGVGIEDRVLLLVPRGIAGLTAMLAIHRLGAAWVPLDPDTPPARIACILDDCAPRLVVRQGKAGLVFEAREGLAPVAPRTDSTPGDAAAYVIYTSGSTGVPKGVVVSRSGLDEVVTDVASYYGLHSKDRVLQFASWAFDMSVVEIFPTLASGAALHVRDDAMLSMEELAAHAGAMELSILNFPTTFFHVLADAISHGLTLHPSVRIVMIGGEAVHADAVASFGAGTEGRVRLVNIYGPTEVVVSASMHDCIPADASHRVPIGRVRGGTSAYVLDANGELLPRGAVGELCVTRGLARGYLHRPELTAERFVPDPFSVEPGSRMYRTGDLVRYRSDGALEYLGRLDYQVKVRGFRIEPGEIESRLEQHPLVKHAVVMAREDDPGRKQLVAYIVGDANAGVLKKHLKETLADYMVPSAFVFLEAMPRTPNGKLDRRALPPPSNTAYQRDYVAPRTEYEVAVAAAFQEVLGLERVGASDDFFDLGGHSLLATRVASKLRDQFGINLALRVFFEVATVETVAAALSREIGRSGAVIPRLTPRRVPSLDRVDQLSESELDAMLSDLTGEDHE